MAIQQYIGPWHGISQSSAVWGNASRSPHGCALLDFEGTIEEPDLCYYRRSVNDVLALSDCLLQVIRKDPWGCFRNLKPSWARANAWVHCCGGAQSGTVPATVMIAPCPPLQCCVSERLPASSSSVHVPHVHPHVQQVPTWLTCASDQADVRWSRFHSYLESDIFSATDLPELASELVAFQSTDEKLDSLQRLRKAHVFGWASFLDYTLCFVGYAHALYISAVHADSTAMRNQYRVRLAQLMNIGPLADRDIVPLAWILDNAGWPITARELVGFALLAKQENDASNNPANIFANAPVITPDLNNQMLRSTVVGVQSILLLSSHLFALDPALAFLEATSLSAGMAPSTPELRWYGFPEKFAREGYGHITRICASKYPQISCGGPGAKALDRLIELITCGSASRTSATLGPHWPYNVHSEHLSRQARVSGILWTTLVAELAALMFGALADYSNGIIFCGYPTVLCLALDAALDAAPVFLLVALSGVPVEYSEPHLQEHLFDRLSTMNTQPRRQLLHFSLFDEAYLRHVINLHVPRVNFGARYMLHAVQTSPGLRQESSCSHQILVSHLQHAVGPLGSQAMWILMNDMCARSHCPVRFVSYASWVDYDVLKSFRAGVFFPWNWELITFLEWYALGMPTWTPNLKWTVPLILHSLHTNSTSTWMNLRHYWAHGRFSHARLPVDNVAQIADWWRITDYAKLPQVRHFAHLADLLAQVARCDFRAWAKEMRMVTQAANRKATEFYVTLYTRLLPKQA